MTRFFAALLLALPAWAQFSSLATPSDGSAVYFTTTLRLKGRPEPLTGKVFAANESGVRLVASREGRKPRLPDNYSGNCVLGALYSFYSVELSGDGSDLAAPGWRWTAGQCHGAGAATLLRTPAGSADVSGTLRISANGRWVGVDTTFSAFSQTTGSILDRADGGRTDFQLNGPGGVQFASGRAIADDGTALFSNNARGYLLKPGGAPQAFSYGYPLAISATGTRALYLTDAIHLVDLPTGGDEQLSAAGRPGGAGLTDDGNRAAFVQDGQLYVSDFGGSGARKVTNEADGLAQAILSGNGRVAYAVTGTGRLVRIAVESGETAEIVARTPDVMSTGGYVDAGMFTTITGVGFAEQSFSAAAPLPLVLGGVSVTVGGRAVPIARVTPNAIDVLAPWDMAGGAAVEVMVQAPSQSPFAAPEGTIQVGNGGRAGALYRADWSPVSDLTVHTGEVIHVYAVGLGAVTPEVAPGAAAPSSEPLARLASPMTCTNAQVLYAGLQPGTVARTYQMDLRIGSQTGYQRFDCEAGGSGLGLTLNVLP